MALEKPVAIFTGRDNQEAQMIRGQLNLAQIEAYVVLEQTPSDSLLFGAIPISDRRQVWVNQWDAEQAQIVIEEFLQRLAKRTVRPDGSPIILECEKCGHLNSFPSTQDGTVQECKKCFSYMDVGIYEFDFDWSGENNQQENSGDPNEENAS